MQEDLSRALQRLEDDLQGALQHRRDTDKHNQVRKRSIIGGWAGVTSII